MNILVRGRSHLAQTLAKAALLHGFDVLAKNPHLEIIAEDILDHSDLGDVEVLVGDSLLTRGVLPRPIVIASQVPPGTMRRWATGYENVYYQVDTIIMRNALERAYRPEQIVVGCNDPYAPLPLAYQEYLMAHECPVLQMSYESAEVAKCAINYMLMKQIEAANDLSGACDMADADYKDVVRVLRNDVRIGQHAYLRAGKTNQHLDRDVAAIRRLMVD